METKHNKLTVALMITGALLLIASGCLAYYTWWKGQTAQAAAMDLLEGHISDSGIVSVLQIDAIGLELPVLWEYSEKNLETTVCRYQGPDPGGAGNLVITGHDYLSGAHFGSLDKVDKGDAVLLYGQDGAAHRYTVNEIQVVEPDDVEALNAYEGERVLTLMTCADNANRRLLVRCIPEG